MGEAAAHDLALRATAAAGPARVAHLPALLWHAGPGQATDPAAHRRAAAAALQAAGEAARVEPAPLAPQWNRVVRALPDPAPLVSVIVPTRDRAALLEAVAEGVLRRTDYPAIELLVVDNGSEEAATLVLFDRLRADPRVRILAAPGPFNYSALNNRAAAEARGEILLLLNNDIEVIEPGWLREMVSHAVRPEIGAVGAKLLYADGRLQHGGVVTGVGGVADHSPAAGGAGRCRLLRLARPGAAGRGGDRRLPGAAPRGVRGGRRARCGEPRRRLQRRRSLRADPGSRLPRALDSPSPSCTTSRAPRAGRTSRRRRRGASPARSTSCAAAGARCCCTTPSIRRG
ncbi:glycosyltransferase [Dankookia sp. P2]|uniref:glycosyltransferase n=1 Tax=Dankookia sp. P2 TaxID=3423955 RepID=UPI003D678D12